MPKVTYFDKENFNLQNEFTGFGSKTIVIEFIPYSKNKNLINN